MTRTICKAKFISFEGGEGSGKSTQINLLEKALQKKGLSVIRTREPGGTIGAELLRSVLQETEDAQWDPVSQTLILYAARRDLVEKVIRPALHKNVWVLSDRFADSTYVYQGYTQDVSIDFIDSLHTYTLNNLWPDLTFHLDLSPEKGFKRVEGRNMERSPDAYHHDIFEAQDMSFHKRVQEGFQDLAAQHPNRIVTIPAQFSVDQTHHSIITVLNDRFDLRL